MDGSVVFARWRQYAPPHIESQKMVAVATSLITSKSAMSSWDSLTLKTQP